MCGIRKLNEAFDIYDPRLDSYVPKNLSSCSNIADNPLHVALQDKLIGMQHIVYTRRVKFIAVSKLSDDYLDTNGWLSAIEGEFESGNLISLIDKMGQFGFDSGNEIKSAFIPPIRSEFETALDYRYRFMQYVKSYNDRAAYSLACVLDDVCPVNYRDQLTDGQK